MVAFSSILLGLAAATATLAAPAQEASAEQLSQLATRGDPNFILDDNHPLMLARRNASLAARTNYVQNYKTGGTVNFTPSNGKFSVNFNTNQDFVVGVGWNPGSTTYVQPFKALSRPRNPTHS
jgi:endo-1,4-beta-xylanase